MPWTGHDRRDRLPNNWKRLRALVLDRDGYRCTQVLPDGTRCTAVANQVDHVQRGDNHSLGNLAAMCWPHHASKTGREGAAAKPTRKRPPERHPGLL